MSEYTMELTMVEDTIENDLAQGATQKHVASLYAMAIVSSWPTEWGRVNAAIRNRWPKGLARVKELAWAELRERNAALGDSHLTKEK